ncbi:MAG: MFS transporter [Bacteroidales bacterium]|nr:MFS transporter [Bacteroidales bacterium]MBQ8035070.1 MFS transporter [Bacteroidales bacterium]MBQ8645963.1 MFS transporter [Bacteroidales bacterium]
MSNKKGFERNFWVAIIMEFFERGAYYGVLSVLSVYLVISGNEGGLGFSKAQAGTIMGTIQPLLYFLPIIAGGIADRYGYRRILFFAFTCITAGYLFTAITHSYIPVFASLLLMAVGAGFFKPVISGTIAKSTTEENSTLGFGIFYWSINLGAFLVPLILVPILKARGYNNIFYMAAAVGCILMLINTFIYREPKANVEIRKKLSENKDEKSVGKMVMGILGVLKDVKFITLIFLYSGFWILYFQMYGTVLWYLKEYVDMTPLNEAVNSFLGIFVSNPSWKFDTEHVTVINAGVIICLQLIVSRLVQKWPALPTMIMGIGCGTLGMFILSLGSTPWVFITGLMVFTLGEMTTHPKFLSYIGIIAPPDKKALYMGYSFLYGVIGSSIGSFLGAGLYVKIVEQMHQPQLLWLIFTGIGVLSIVGLLLYNKIVKR